MNCKRVRASFCSRTDWRSIWLRLGSVPAMKSASRPISVILLAAVPSSSERFGVAATSCVNSLSTFCRSAVSSGVTSGSISGNRSTRARRNRLGRRVASDFHPRHAFTEQQLPFAHPHDLVNHGDGARLVQFVRVRARRCADRSATPRRSICFPPAIPPAPPSRAPHAQRQQGARETTRYPAPREWELFQFRRRIRLRRHNRFHAFLLRSGGAPSDCIQSRDPS